MSNTPALSQAIINHFFRGSSQPTTSCFLALFTARPNQDGTGGTEVAGGSYARQAVTLGAPDASGRSDNTVAIDFTDMPGTTVVAAGLYTLVTGGDLLQHAPVSVPRTVPAGDTYTVPAGDIVVEDGF